MNEEKTKQVEDLIKKESFEKYYEVEHELGRGRFAVVKRCKCRQTGMKYAAKLVKKSRTNSHGRSGREQLLMEIDILNKSTHSKMVRLYNVFETRSEMQLILEYAEGGDLHRHCIESDVARSEKEICYLIRQILEAVRYLHGEKIVHLDLKPDNILLAKKEELFPEIKLIDFGLSRSLEGPYSQFDMVGTAEYVAPEVLAFEPIHYGSDMWGIGVVTYVLLSGISPFAGDDVMETYANIGLVDYDFDCEEFDDISDNAIDFIEKLLLRDPKDRMTAREALEHDWIKQMEGGLSTGDVIQAQRARCETLPSELTVAPLDEEGFTSSSDESDSESLLEDEAESKEGEMRNEKETGVEEDTVKIESEIKTTEIVSDVKVKDHKICDKPGDISFIKDDKIKASEIGVKEDHNICGKTGDISVTKDDRIHPINASEFGVKVDHKICDKPGDISSIEDDKILSIKASEIDTKDDDIISVEANEISDTKDDEAISREASEIDEEKSVDVGAVADEKTTEAVSATDEPSLPDTEISEPSTSVGEVHVVEDSISEDKASDVPSVVETNRTATEANGLVDVSVDTDKPPVQEVLPAEKGAKKVPAVAVKPEKPKNIKVNKLAQNNFLKGLDSKKEDSSKNINVKTPSPKPNKVLQRIDRFSTPQSAKTFTVDKRPFTPAKSSRENKMIRTNSLRNKILKHESEINKVDSSSSTPKVIDLPTGDKTNSTISPTVSIDESSAESIPEESKEPANPSNDTPEITIITDIPKDAEDTPQVSDKLEINKDAASPMFKKKKSPVPVPPKKVIESESPKLPRGGVAAKMAKFANAGESPKKSPLAIKLEKRLSMDKGKDVQDDTSEDVTANKPSTEASPDIDSTKNNDIPVDLKNSLHPSTAELNGTAVSNGIESKTCEEEGIPKSPKSPKSPPPVAPKRNLSFKKSKPPGLSENSIKEEATTSNSQESKSESGTDVEQNNAGNEVNGTESVTDIAVKGEENGVKDSSTELSEKETTPTDIGKTPPRKDSTGLKFSLMLGGAPSGKKLNIGPLVSVANKEKAKARSGSIISDPGTITEEEKDESKESLDSSQDSSKSSSRGKTDGGSRRRTGTGNEESSHRKTYRRLYVTKVRNSRLYEHDFNVDKEAAKIVQRVDKDVLHVELNLKSTDLRLLPP